MKLMKDKLPKRLSTLILHALKDLRKVERDKKYSVDMTVWHLPNSHCSVCFAGSVIAKTFHVSPDKEIDLGNCRKGLARKFLALDDARKGNFYVAQFRLDSSKAGKAEVTTKGIYIPPYSSDHQIFHQRLSLAAKRLKKVSL